MEADDRVSMATANGCLPNNVNHDDLISTVYGEYVMMYDLTPLYSFISDAVIFSHYQ